MGVRRKIFSHRYKNTELLLDELNSQKYPAIRREMRTRNNSSPPERRVPTKFPSFGIARMRRKTQDRRRRVEEARDGRDKRGGPRRVLETSVRELAGNVRQRIARRKRSGSWVEKECI